MPGAPFASCISITTPARSRAGRTATLRSLASRTSRCSRGRAEPARPVRPVRPVRRVIPAPRARMAPTAPTVRLARRVIPASRARMAPTARTAPTVRLVRRVRAARRVRRVIPALTARFPAPPARPDFHAGYDGAPGSGKTVTFTLRKQTGPTALTCSITGTQNTCNAGAASVALTAGDLISVRVTTVGASAKPVTWYAKVSG